MLSELIQEYIKMFKEEPMGNNFEVIPEEEQIKILKECIEKKIPLYENDYFNDNYMEEVI